MDRAIDADSLGRASQAWNVRVGDLSGAELFTLLSPSASKTSKSKKVATPRFEP